MTFADALRRWTSSFIALSDSQVELFHRHYQLLAKWNRRLNLTSVIEPAEAAQKHYAESIFLATHLPSKLTRIADIGSGAGFPGFPVAVLHPGAKVTLVEADIRKSVFLQECRDLLPNLSVANIRAGALQPASFDALISRAVNLAEIAALVPELAPAAFCLASRDSSTWSTKDGFTWNEVATLPWDARSCVLSRGTAKL